MKLKVSTGFTLLETLIYLALFAVIIGGVIAAVYNIVEASGRNQTKVQAQEEANFLLGKINWALTGANGVTVVPSPPSLTVNKYNFGANPLVFDLNGAKLRLKEGSGTAADLNSDSIQVVNLVFQDIPAVNGKPEGVEATFTFRTLTPNGAVTNQDFEITKYLRK